MITGGLDSALGGISVFVFKREHFGNRDRHAVDIKPSMV